MAAITKHTWTRTELDERGRPRRVRDVAYGYDVRVDGKRERKWDGAWRTPADARAALAEREKEIAAGQVTPPERRSLRELADQYLEVKAREGKRTVSDDRRILDRQLLPALGAETVARALTAS